MPHLAIRLLNAADAPAFRVLRLAALNEAPTAFGASPEEEQAQSMTTLAQRLTPGPGHAVFGSGEPLSGCVGLFRHEARKQAHKATLWGLYVAPAQRGAGLARALMVAAMAHAARMPGVSQLRLSVAQDNLAAQRLYASLGFEAYGREPAALRVQGRDLDEILMARPLDGA